MQTPGRMPPYPAAGPGKVTQVVGAEVEERSRWAVAGQFAQKVRLYEAILMVASLWPGVGIKDEDAAKADLPGHCRKELGRLGLEEGDGAGLGAGTAFFGFFKTRAFDVDPEAVFLRVGVPIGDQKVPMSATDLKGQVSSLGIELMASLAEAGDALADALEMLGGGLHGFIASWPAAHWQGSTVGLLADLFRGRILLGVFLSPVSGQEKADRAALSLLTVGEEQSAMLLDDVLDDGETQPGAAALP